MADQEDKQAKQKRENEQKQNIERQNTEREQLRQQQRQTGAPTTTGPQQKPQPAQQPERPVTGREAQQRPGQPEPQRTPAGINEPSEGAEATLGEQVRARQASEEGDEEEEVQKKME